MTRTRWAAGVALAASTLTACGMNAGNGSTAAEGRAGGHVVFAEQFAPPAA